MRSFDFQNCWSFLGQGAYLHRPRHLGHWRQPNRSRQSRGPSKRKRRCGLPKVKFDGVKNFKWEKNYQPVFSTSSHGAWMILLCMFLSIFCRVLEYLNKERFLRCICTTVFCPFKNIFEAVRNFSTYSWMRWLSFLMFLVFWAFLSLKIPPHDDLVCLKVQFTANFVRWIITSPRLKNDNPTQIPKVPPTKLISPT